MNPEEIKDIRCNPLVHDLITGNVATLYFLSDPDSVFMRDARAAVAISRVIPWGISYIQIKPIISRIPRLLIPKEIEEFHKSPADSKDLKDYVGKLASEDTAHGCLKLLEQYTEKYIQEMLNALIEGQRSPDTPLPLFNIPPEGNLWIIGRPELFNFENRGSFENFLDMIGYPARFRFKRPDRTDPNNGQPDRTDPEYRTIIDEQTGISYIPHGRNIMEGILDEDYGIIFKKKISIYSPRFVTIIAGSSTLGTWGTTAFATSQELWKNVSGLSEGTAVQGTLELLIHTKPDTNIVDELHNNNIELVAQALDYPSKRTREQEKIRTVSSILNEMEEKMKEHNAIHIQETIFPKEAFLMSIEIEKYPILPIVGETAKELHEKIETLCKRDTIEDPQPVLVLGERGTGKELVAALIAHYRKKRLVDAGEEKEVGFTATNCAAIPEGVAESELFGHVKGAFADALEERSGVIREAKHGVCFLDEFGELTPQLQPKLLRTLANRTVRPVGQDNAEPTSAKLVAATNKDLIQATDTDEFRSDLLSRFPHSQRLTLKPLRERKQDIPSLIVYWIQESFMKYQERLEEASISKAAEFVKKVIQEVHIDERAMKFFLGFSYPDNVRSLFGILDAMPLTEKFDALAKTDSRPLTFTLEFEEIPSYYITNEFHSLKQTSFKLTEQFLQNLSKEGIPDETLEDIKLLEKHEFTNETEFLNAIEKHIEKELPAHYKELILKNAKSDLVFIPEIPGQEICNNLKHQLEDVVKQSKRVNQKPSADQVQNIIETTNFDSILKILLDGSIKEITKDMLKEAISPINSQRTMDHKERGKLFQKPIWKKIENKNLAWLFGCSEDTIRRARNSETVSSNSPNSL